MEDFWDANTAAGFDGDLGQLVYGSRLLGAEPALVLHGGGNTSVKSTMTDVLGADVAVLHVKGSGHDLATIGPEGFAPLRLERARGLGSLEEMTDTQMVNELRGALLDSDAPTPSVEAILHASLPHPAVLHTHADAILALTDTADDEATLRDCFGDRLVLVPYVMPGFPLARECAQRFPAEAHADTVGMLLRQHGLFTFGSTVEEAYHRMIELVTEAEEYVAQRRSGPARPPVELVADPVAQADLRRAVSTAAGAPVVLVRHADEQVGRFLARDDLDRVTQHGPITPDHVIRTKRVPLVGRDVDAYAGEYEQYVDENRQRATTPITPLDPAPRVILDQRLGMLTAGRHDRDAAIASDIYRHTMAVIDDAESIGGYVALPDADLFDVEYWELEQAKLQRSAPPPLAGQVAVVTGAASGIGRACADRLEGDGAAVVGLDIDPDIEGDAFGRIGIAVDLCDPDATTIAVDRAVERFGGIDILVAAAGIFGASRPISELDDETWRSTLAVNADANVGLFRGAHPFLARSPVGGRVIAVASRNVLAPGAGAAAYSASKAALTQLCRVAALEWATDGIRVNTVHPDAVFDTGLWTDELLEARAERYGLTVDEYRRRNLLGVEITSHDVAALVAAMCGPGFRAVTGAQIPIDGGSDRVV